MKNNHLWSPKIGKKTLQDKVFKINSSEIERNRIPNKNGAKKKKLMVKKIGKNSLPESFKIICGEKK